MDFSKKEKEAEIISINESIKAHEQQIQLHEKMLKSEKYLKLLIEKDLVNR